MALQIEQVVFPSSEDVLVSACAALPTGWLIGTECGHLLHRSDQPEPDELRPSQSTRVALPDAPGRIEQLLVVLDSRAVLARCAHVLVYLTLPSLDVCWALALEHGLTALVSARPPLKAGVYGADGAARVCVADGTRLRLYDLVAPAVTREAPRVAQTFELVEPACALVCSGRFVVLALGGEYLAVEKETGQCSSLAAYGAGVRPLIARALGSDVLLQVGSAAAPLAVCVRLELCGARAGDAADDASAGSADLRTYAHLPLRPGTLALALCFPYVYSLSRQPTDPHDGLVSCRPLFATSAHAAADDADVSDDAAEDGWRGDGDAHGDVIAELPATPPWAADTMPGSSTEPRVDAPPPAEPSACAPACLRTPALAAAPSSPPDASAASSAGREGDGEREGEGAPPAAPSQPAPQPAQPAPRWWAGPSMPALPTEWSAAAAPRQPPALVRGRRPGEAVLAAGGRALTCAPSTCRGGGGVRGAACATLYEVADLRRAFEQRAHPLGALVSRAADELDAAWRRWLDARLGGRAASEAVGRVRALVLSAVADAARQYARAGRWTADWARASDAAVFAAVSAVVADVYKTCHADADTAYAAQLGALRAARPSELGICADLYAGAGAADPARAALEAFRPAVGLLRTLSGCATFAAQLHALADACETACALGAARAGAPLGADELVPVFALVVLHARLGQLPSTLLALSDICEDEALGRAGYALVTAHSALQLLRCGAEASAAARRRDRDTAAELAARAPPGGESLSARVGACASSLVADPHAVGRQVLRACGAALPAALPLAHEVGAVASSALGWLLARGARRAARPRLLGHAQVLLRAACDDDAMRRGWLTLTTHTLSFARPCDRAAADARAQCDARACALGRGALLVDLVSVERVEVCAFADGLLASGLAIVTHDDQRHVFANFVSRARVRDAIVAQRDALACWSLD
jgi:hypothetical protein